MCIFSSRECDGHRDCSDNSDEETPKCSEFSLGQPVASLCIMNSQKIKVTTAGLSNVEAGTTHNYSLSK